MMYADLVAAILAFRDDPEITQSVNTFIALAESQMNRKLACREMWGVTHIQPFTERYSLPRDFQAVQSLKCYGATGHGKLTYVSPEQMDDMVGDYGPPRHYSIIGQDLVLPYVPAPTVTPPTGPPPIYGMRMRYRRRLSPLGPTCLSNWCLEKNPDAYLYGCLTNSCQFKADDRAEAWGNGFAQALTDIEDMDRRVIADTIEMRSDTVPSHWDHWDRAWDYP
jgi:hypothetical protein